MMGTTQRTLSDRDMKARSPLETKCQWQAAHGTLLLAFLAVWDACACSFWLTLTCRDDTSHSAGPLTGRVSRTAALPRFANSFAGLSVTTAVARSTALLAWRSSHADC